MPKPFKLFSTRPLPPDADIVDVDGRPHVRLKDRGRAILCAITKDGRNYLRPSKRWYFKYRDANRNVRRVKGFADLKATEQLAAEMERKESRRRVGIIDPAEEHVRRPLVDHLKDYGDALEGRGSTAKHVRDTVARCSAAFAGCGFAMPLDLDAAKLTAWLNSIRKDRPPVSIPPGDEFPPSVVCRLLGVGASALASAIRRHKLAASGAGPSRRLPRPTVEFLTIQQSKGASPRTVNAYIVAIRGFARWMIRNVRMGSDPFATLGTVNAAVDVRRGRRELDAAELGRLFVAARDSVRSFRGLTGRDRYFLYIVAAGTGFRANALANLTPADFELNPSSPFVTLAARFNKSRKVKVQPLPLDVADALRDYLADRPANAPVWGGTWASGCTAAEMIRRDLDAAGIAYAVDGPNGAEYADFHSLRHSYLTLGGRSGIDLRTLQELAGHSTPALTARYSHRRLYDLAGAVDKLPHLVPPPTPAAESATLRRTGTDDVPGVPPGVPAGYAEPHRTASISTFDSERAGKAEVTQTLEKSRAGASLHRPALFSTKAGVLGFEPRQTDPESVCRDSEMSASKKVTPNVADGRTAGRTREASEGGISDPDLARLAAAWDRLPEHVRRTILVIADAATT